MFAIEVSLLGIIIAGKKWRFWPKSAIFFSVNNFPHHNNKKKPDSDFWALGVMGHDTLHVAFNMFNKHI